MPEVQETFHKNFNLFTHITNPILRNWNRFVTIMSIMSQVNTEEASRYRSRLPKEEQEELKILFKRIKTDGFSVLRQEARSQV